MDFSLLATCHPQQSDFSSGRYHNRLLHTFTAPNLAKLAANLRQLLAFSPENMVVGVGCYVSAIVSQTRLYRPG